MSSRQSAASSRSSARFAAARPPKRLGSEAPRVWTPPLRELTSETSLGFECIAFAEDVLGITLHPWQKWLLIHALELTEDGSFRFRTVVVLVARQNGKSTLAQILSLWRMYVDGAQLVIGTAQNLDIAEEVWQGAVDIATDVPELADEVDQVIKVNGKKTLKLRSGERYRVTAASRRGGRGLSGDLVLLDELREHQTWDAWGAVTKTTMARSRAQIWALSNAGDAASIVLRFLRRLAHGALGNPDGLDDMAEPDEAEDGLDGVDESMGIFEWSAPPGCALNDRNAWAQANPSLGHPEAITERAIESAMRTDPEWVFRTEVLCQWSDGTLEGPFPPGAWEAGRDPDSQIPDGAEIVPCLDVSWDRARSHVAVASLRPDGLVHAEIAASRAGTDWPVAWLAERGDLFAWRVVLQSSGAPVSSLADELRVAGFEVLEWKGAELGRACGAVYDLVREGRVRHLGQPVLDIAAATAVTRPNGDAWVWDRKKSSTDISPLVAVTGAAWMVQPKPAEVEPEPRLHDWPDDDVIAAWEAEE